MIKEDRKIRKERPDQIFTRDLSRISSTLE